MRGTARFPTHWSWAYIRITGVYNVLGPLGTGFCPSDTATGKPWHGWVAHCSPQQNRKWSTPGPIGGVEPCLWSMLVGPQMGSNSQAAHRVPHSKHTATVSHLTLSAEHTCCISHFLSGAGHAQRGRLQATCSHVRLLPRLLASQWLSWVLLLLVSWNLK